MKNKWHKFNKTIRTAVYNKTKGHCAYCGSKLENFQVDHIIPQKKFQEYIKNKNIPDFLQHLKEDDVHHIDNLLASCGGCNIYKNTYSLEEFRKELESIEERLHNKYTTYQIIKRFGIVKTKKKKIKFYFETL